MVRTAAHDVCPAVWPFCLHISSVRGYNKRIPERSLNMQIIQLDSMGFERITASGTALVEFYTSTCPSCHASAGIVRRFAEKSSVPVYTLNLDDAPDAAEHWHIMSVPTFILFHDGIAIGRRIGVPTMKILEDLADSALSPAT